MFAEYNRDLDERVRKEVDSVCAHFPSRQQVEPARSVTPEQQAAWDRYAAARESYRNTQAGIAEAQRLEASRLALEEDRRQQEGHRKARNDYEYQQLRKNWQDDSLFHILHDHWRDALAFGWELVKAIASFTLESLRRGK